MRVVSRLEPPSVQDELPPLLPLLALLLFRPLQGVLLFGLLLVCALLGSKLLRLCLATAVARSPMGVECGVARQGRVVAAEKWNGEGWAESVSL